MEKDREGKRTRRTVGWDKGTDNCRQRARKENEDREGRTAVWEDRERWEDTGKGRRMSGAERQTLSSGYVAAATIDVLCLWVIH